METLKRIGSIVLLMVFLFGITGLSVFHHTCSCSNEEHTVLYTDIFKEAPGNCCGDESMDIPVDRHSAQSPAFDASSCCKSTTTFLALHIISERQDKSVMLPALSFGAPLSLALPGLSLENPLLIHAVHYQFHSPPRFGKQLVHYLHQIKIPTHPELA
jgi:hypothetical protein